jgi:NitT/TauT family transport system substrate-binding protein
MPMMQTRRRFLTTLAAAGGAGFAHAPRVRAAQEAPETASVRIDKDRSTCAAPQDVAEQLLRAEGFTDIRYVEMEPYRPAAALGHNPIVLAMERGEIDFAMNFPVLFIPGIETGAPITVLGGVHSARTRTR